MRISDALFFFHSLRKELSAERSHWVSLVSLAAVLAGLTVAAVVWTVPAFNWGGLRDREFFVLLAGQVLVPFLVAEAWSLEFRQRTWMALRLGGHFHQTVIVKNLAVLLKAQLPVVLALLTLVPLGLFDGVEPGLLANGAVLALVLAHLTGLVSLWLVRTPWVPAWAVLTTAAVLTLVGVVSRWLDLPLIEARTFFVLAVLTGLLHFGLRTLARHRRP